MRGEVITFIPTEDDCEVNGKSSGLVPHHPSSSSSRLIRQRDDATEIDSKGLRVGPSESKKPRRACSIDFNTTLNPSDANESFSTVTNRHSQNDAGPTYSSDHWQLSLPAVFAGLTLQTSNLDLQGYRNEQGRHALDSSPCHCSDMNAMDSVEFQSSSLRSAVQLTVIRH